MTKTDFAELKEKLVRFDSDDTALNKMIKDENCAWASYDKMSHIEKVEAHDALLDIAYYQHTKSAAIISELIEIIQSQSEALKLYKELVWNIHPKQESERYAAKTCLSETTTRLQKLRDGI